MENTPLLTPREILEERRIWRWWLRWFVKYNARFNPQRICALVTSYLTWAKLLAKAAFLKEQAQRLKALVLIPKFCKGLTGVSRTDSLIAPLVN
ncbi:hypothetical protein QUB10_12350 [Microcoleus sp. B5-D4]|uniref:hypothetical protein n=1 Tax=unclassified Microcoleus TaxID=2642155 RepID=UPI002FD69D2B